MENTTDRQPVISGYIYGLFDSRRPLLLWEVRYIGLTTKRPDQRLTRHIAETRWRGRGNRRLKWIRSVLSEDGNVIVKVFETHQAESKSALDTILKRRERAWIAEGRRSGWRLVNGTEGGDGTLGRYHSDDTKAKIGAKSLGRIPTAETRAKLSIARQGNKNALGLRHTEESKARMSAASSGSNAWNATVTEDDVKEIRRLRADGVSRREVATRFGATVAVIGGIDRGVTWRHVT